MYRILAIEDDTMMHRVFRDILKPEGFELLIGPTGAEGLRQASEAKPDLILLDVNLPDMNGVDVCRALKSGERTRHIPVLMITGAAWQVEQRISGLDVGAEDYMHKPISPRVLVSRIRAILRSDTKPV